MNNEEATYRFRRTVAEVLKALTDSAGPEEKRRDILDITEEQDRERDDDG